MTREEFDRDMELFKFSSCPHDMYDLAYDYIESLEQQNTAWADMVEMQSQKIAYLKHNYEMQEIMINDYKQSIAKLQEEKDGLQSLVDFKQQEISVFESSIEGLVIQKSQAYRQGADDVYLLLTGKKVYD